MCEICLKCAYISDVFIVGFEQVNTGLFHGDIMKQRPSFLFLCQDWSFSLVILFTVIFNI